MTNPDESDLFNSVSCPSISLCVATGGDFDNEIATSIDPTGGAGAWTMATLALGNGRLLSISCARRPRCVLYRRLLPARLPLTPAETLHGQQPDRRDRGLDGSTTCGR